MKIIHIVVAAIWLGAVHSMLLRSSKTSSSAFSLFKNNDWDSPHRSPSSSRLFDSPKINIEQQTVSDNDNDSNRSDNDEASWELMEDWVLQDREPVFTVQSSTLSSATTPATKATFWRQLKHTTPELSTRTERELEERYNVLASAPPKTDSVENRQDGGASFIECGQSPEVLTNWWMDVVEKKTNSANIMMMYGRLSNGSNIWFPLQSAGTVGSVSNENGGDAVDSGFSWLEEEGDYIKYVESSAGCIYELGMPKQNSSIQVGDKKDETNFLEGSGAVADKAKEWLSSKTSMGKTLPAVVTTSLLSASLAFFAGQASLPSQPPPTAKPVVVVTKQQIPSQAVTPAILGSGMKYERALQRDGTVKVVELSVPEQRASQELRVYREERKLTSLQEKLKNDQAALQDLKAQEAQLGPVASNEGLVAVPRSPKELPVSEQRARAELKIGVDKRRIRRMEESLTNDKAKLKDLQLEEKQLGRKPF